MNELEWLTCAVPVRMMRRGGSAEPRAWFPRPGQDVLPIGWRRYLAACCWRVCLVGAEGRARELIEYAEGFVERAPGEMASRRVQGWLRGGAPASLPLHRLLWGMTSPLARAAGELRNVVGHHAGLSAARKGREAALRDAQAAEARAHCALIRDIVGNPFRPPTFDPAWRTRTAAGLAQAAHDERLMPSRELDPARLAVLSDALEEAGCTDTDILGHLRSPGPHVRGCWVVDLILDKERAA